MIWQVLPNGFLRIHFRVVLHERERVLIVAAPLDNQVLDFAVAAEQTFQFIFQLFFVCLLCLHVFTVPTRFVTNILWPCILSFSLDRDLPLLFELLSDTDIALL